MFDYFMVQSTVYVKVHTHASISKKFLLSYRCLTFHTTSWIFFLTLVALLWYGTFCTHIHNKTKTYVGRNQASFFRQNYQLKGTS